VRIHVDVIGDAEPGYAIAPATGRTTEALLFCEVEQAWNRHRFVRENKVAEHRSSVELIFACACGKAERRWGWEDR